MPEFRLLIADHRESEVTIDVDDSAEAMNAGFNALAQFACRNFPPPENVEITVSDADNQPVGKLKMSFEVTWAKNASA
ncbi:hypothetical protein ABID21_003020 [Pseudorhizobium tarimense]|uniref:Uncharacterized protein n=1 Tax=Pseudorhizobium tarimense TaxID=1079109 RepID=A0ABV2H8M7_9HYPH|nr:hypothetical protein [Pseudorhizobium tarimense]MCJ8520024.1 hypothetical protein [Pseudorhizobium tarimense]